MRKKNQGKTGAPTHLCDMQAQPPHPGPPTPLKRADGNAGNRSEATVENGAADWWILLRETPDDPDLQMQFAAWHDADPRHAVAWSEMAATAHAIRMVPPEWRSVDLPTATPAWHIRRHASVPRRPGRQNRQGRPIRHVAIAAAAACLAIIAAPTIMLHASADHLSGTAEVRTVRLEDGSVVDLAPHSAIAIDYTAEVRGVRLIAGDAMFEVAHNPARPFQVDANGVETTVLGTGFDVQMVDDGAQVAVRHGRVRVRMPADPMATRELGAGDRAVAMPDREIALSKETPELVGAWRHGRLIVRNESIGDAIDRLRPWYGGKIIVTDDAVAHQRISGAYDLRDPQRSLSLIVAPHGGRVIRVTPWLMIVTGS